MLENLPQELYNYCVDLFYRLHMCPEIGFDLYETTAIVEEALRELEIPYTTRYGKCSLVGYIGNKENVPTLGLRADMDALPIQEQVDVPYASRNPGVMHACGHDSHTAIMLTVAKILKSMEKELPCNIRLFFQPSEESGIGGAKMMVENGCLDGVDAVTAVHCEGVIPSGTLGIQRGYATAACATPSLTFHGVTSHAAIPERGVDAVAMAVESYTALKEMVRQEAGNLPYIWSVGVFHGGETHNVIPDLCTQRISFRFYDTEFAERVHRRTDAIIHEIAGRYGGRAELDWNMICGPVYNNETLVDKFCEVVEKMPGTPLVHPEPKRTSEDFAWFAAERPGFLFRFGTYNEAKGCIHTVHRPDFRIDEEAMKPAVLAVVNFVLEYDPQWLNNVS